MSDFTDLRARVVSAVVMVAVGAGAVWAGGWVFAALAVLLAGLMGWELWRMMAPADPFGRAEAAGLVAALLVAIFTLYQPGWIGLGGLALGALVMAGRMPRDKGIFGLYYGLILWAAHGFILLREGLGLTFLLWLLLIVIASDVAGYFAGRILGGPKFWPRISPKKTWSGTVAGWIAAAIFAGFWMGQLLDSVPLAVVSGILIAFCGQMGDIAASAIKRRVGVKDASNLIPGHGGFMDRLDAMIAAAAATIVFALVF